MVTHSPARRNHKRLFQFAALHQTPIKPFNFYSIIIVFGCATI